MATMVSFTQCQFMSDVEFHEMHFPCTLKLNSSSHLLYTTWSSFLYGKVLRSLWNFGWVVAWLMESFSPSWVLCFDESISILMSMCLGWVFWLQKTHLLGMNTTQLAVESRDFFYFKITQGADYPNALAVEFAERWKTSGLLCTWWNLSITQEGMEHWTLGFVCFRC